MWSQSQNQSLPESQSLGFDPESTLGMYSSLFVLYIGPSTMLFWPVYNSCRLCYLCLYMESRVLILSPESESSFFRVGVQFSNPKVRVRHDYTIGTLDVLQACGACANMGMTYSVIVQCADCVVFPRVPQKIRTPHPWRSRRCRSVDPSGNLG